MGRERRRHPRIRCRLRARVAAGRQRVEARILDLSEGGLCLLSPTPVKAGETIELEVEVPGRGPVDVQATAWHARPVRSRSTRRRQWSIGMILVKGVEELASLLPPPAGARGADGGGLGESALPPPCSREGPDDAAAAVQTETDEAVPLVPFRVRVQAPHENRTRLLTLAAVSEDEARALAREELPEWEILEIAGPRRR